MPFDPTNLRPGMLLLYEASSVFGYAIALFSGSRISHVEMYKGDGKSWASRDGLGVGVYPFRSENLALVLESPVPLNLAHIAQGFAAKAGHTYDYATILKFITFGWTESRTDAEVCSELITYLLRTGGLTALFGIKEPEDVKPADFVTALNLGMLRKVWIK